MINMYRSYQAQLYVHLVVICTSLLCMACQAQPEQQEKSFTNAEGSVYQQFYGDQSVIFDSLMVHAKNQKLHALEIGEIIVRVGEWFEKSPYEAGTLDTSDYEQLVIKLDGFDCVTFVESTYALAKTIQDQSYSFQSFVDQVKEFRYRSGYLDGYCSRLHYFSEWIIDNEKKGYVRNVTEEIGELSYPKCWIL